ncbi:MFS transporter [Lysinibacillus sp. FSL K6-0057]|jgi:polyol permease family|uniref:MFS transporter n=1 Tax=Lysinibacillus TaxID=400634 RepID=UPI002175BFDB|nr:MULTISPECIES: MFS transporter [Lysinibacillus]MCS5500476.1 MFS transporter [Lysinibacillus sp. A4]
MQSNLQATSVGKLGMDKKMFMGYLGVLIFMIGDGLEQGWLSTYLTQNGMTVQEVATLLSFYGIAVAIASWLSGVLAEIYGPRKMMIIGLSLFVLGTLIFLLIGITTMNLSIMLPTYALRGLGYPLFAYSFLVWITYYAPIERLGTAVGWFWVSFAGGLNMLGAYYSSFALPFLGEMMTLWSALIFTAIGAVFGIILCKPEVQKTNLTIKEAMKQMTKGITIAFEKPRVGLGGIVRAINTSGAYGLVVFLPAYMIDAGFTMSQWLQIYGALWASNVIFNLIWGAVADKIGWQRTVMWIGGLGCAVFMAGLYYVPYFLGANYLMTIIVAMCFGSCLAAYVPLSALVPSLAPENRGAAMSILNLGAGLSTFLGPAVAGALIGGFGAVGVIWAYVTMHIISAGLMIFVRLPKGSKQTDIPKEVVTGH